MPVNHTTLVKHLHKAERDQFRRSLPKAVSHRGTAGEMKSTRTSPVNAQRLTVESLPEHEILHILLGITSAIEKPGLMILRGIDGGSSVIGDNKREMGGKSTREHQMPDKAR
jgi:hypothetical protein